MRVLRTWEEDTYLCPTKGVLGEKRSLLLGREHWTEAQGRGGVGWRLLVGDEGNSICEGGWLERA